MQRRTQHKDDGAPPLPQMIEPISAARNIINLCKHKIIPLKLLAIPSIFMMGHQFRKPHSKCLRRIPLGRTRKCRMISRRIYIVFVDETLQTFSERFHIPAPKRSPYLKLCEYLRIHIIAR